MNTPRPTSKQARTIAAYRLKSEMVNLTLIVLSLVAFPAIIGSLLRAIETGMQPVMYLHVVTGFSLFVITLWRNSISFTHRAIFTIILFATLGIGGLLNFGLSSAALAFFIASTIYATVLFNKKTGLISCCFSIVILVVFMALVQAGLIQYHVDFNRYNQSWTSWLSFILSFTLIAAVLWAVLARFNQFFFDMVENLEEHIEANTRELKLANKAKSEFLANMSHEIRTPMNGVLGMLKLLSTSDLNESQRHKTNLAKSSAESLLSIINDVLDFSKVDSGKMELDSIDFNLRTLLDEIAEAHALKLEEKGVELIIDQSEVTSTLVNGDPGKLRQVFNNLVGNAVKFTESGEIIIRAKLTSLSDNKLQLICTIKDSGIGISQEKIDSLFKAFSQGDSSTTRRFGGTGLGLTISQRFCQLMQGDISVSSKLGQGSTFRMTVVLQASENSNVVLPETNIRDLNILIMDSNLTSLDVISKQLSIWGAKVEQTQYAKAGLELCRARSEALNQRPFTAVFIDMNLDDLNGLIVAQTIQQDPMLNSIQIILMTRLSFMGDYKDYDLRGITHYFPKPATTSDLFKSIKYIMTKETPTDTKTSANKHVEDIDTDVNDSYKLEEIRKKKPRVLVVEDNYVNQQVALGLLEKLGVTVDIANDGLEAIDKLRDGKRIDPYDLILMDCQMPKLDGYQTSQRIRLGDAGKQYQDVIIIAMTANAMEGDRDKCLQAGMSDYLSKPIEINLLLEKLHHWLIKEMRVSSNEEFPPINNNLIANKPLQNNIKNSVVWDHEAFVKRLMNKEDLVLKVINAFLNEIDTTMQRLHESLIALDLEKIQFLAHTLKGTAGSISAFQLQSLAFSLENAAKNNELDKNQSELALKDLKNAQESLTRILVAYQQSHTLID